MALLLLLYVRQALPKQHRKLRQQRECGQRAEDSVFNGCNDAAFCVCAHHYNHYIIIIIIIE